MGRVYETAPGVAITCLRIDRSKLEMDLASGGIDLVIDITIPVSDAIAQTQLSNWEFVVVSRKNHPAIKGNHLNLKTYLLLQHILASSHRSGATLVDIELRNRGGRRTTAMRCQDPLTAGRVVSQTDLLLTIPECYAHAANVGLDNQFHRFPIKTARYREYLYWHRGFRSRDSLDA
jgi:DNA-binding transcriptional LysR family regulator